MTQHSALRTESDMAKNNPGDRNIFNITDPDQYRCQVYHYHTRLSRLYMRVFKGAAENPVFYLLFTDVALMDCPVNWQGADFEIAAAEDCIGLMLEAGLIGKAILQFPGAYASLTDYARLYRVETTHRPIQIIANSASLLHQLPKEI
jgi:hypothetical protein